MEAQPSTLILKHGNENWDMTLRLNVHGQTPSKLIQTVPALTSLPVGPVSALL